jgi:cyclic pyranopterin phosphate synthase
LRVECRKDTRMASAALKFVSKLRVSLTDRCNLRCDYCMPPQGVPLVPHSEILRYEEIAKAARLIARSAGLGQVRLTGGEPLIRPHVPRLVEMLKATGAGEVTLTTNGHLLAREAAALRSAGLDRVNISLDTLRPEVYAAITRGGEISAALAGIEAALAAGFAPVKINAIVLRDANLDELPDMVLFAADRGLEIRFLEAMRIGQLAAGHEDRFVPLREMLSVLERRFEVELGPHPPGGTSRPAALKDRRTGREHSIGFIASESAPFCSSCARLRLTAEGMLLPCLLSCEGEDLRGFLRSGSASPGEFEALLARVQARKPALRARENLQYMSKIGG